MDENLDDLLTWAVKLAHEAGAIMREYFDKTDKNVEVKSDETPLTIADTKINSLVIERVSSRFPAHGVLGEEASLKSDSRKLWVCDPIDGTKAFIQGIPVAMFSLAFVVDGQPLVAVAYEPLLDKLFTAVKGKGASLNDRPLDVSSHASLQDAQIGVSPSMFKLDMNFRLFKSLLDVGAKPAVIPGEVFRGSLTASGKIDAHIFPGRSAHDVAAEYLIVEEAGGRVTDLDGNEQRYDSKIRGAILSNGHLHAELVKLMKQVGPENYLGY